MVDYGAVAQSGYGEFFFSFHKIQISIPRARVIIA